MIIRVMKKPLIIIVNFGYMFITMKRLVFLLCCLLTCGMAWAEEHLLVIAFTDGTEATFALSRKPVLTFAEQQLCLAVEGQASEFELSDVANFHFAEGAQCIRAPRAEADFALSWLDDDHLEIHPALPGSRIVLYGLDGTVYPGHVRVFDGRAEVTLAALPKGMYLLNINNRRTFKINRK